MEHPKTQSLNFLNKVQKHSTENGKEIFKQLCKQCGGKGFYLHYNMNPDTMKIDKKELLSCDKCEDGFIYGPRETH